MRYFLGCPGWGDKRWVGRLFPVGTRSEQFLQRYAQVFNTVEGNTTFYALPTEELVAKWREAVPDSFRFCFKFPKTITHDHKLQQCDGLVEEFLARLHPLRDVLGTLMVQLPPMFDASMLPVLAAFLDRLPRSLELAVEFRHASLIMSEDAYALLADRGVDLVVMDTRGMRASQSLEFADVRARKPDLPLVVRATGMRPIVRCVPHERFADSAAVVGEWAAVIAKWLAEGRTPRFFMHAPDDTEAPANAYAFHAMLQALDPTVGSLPPWPTVPTQLGLF